MKKRICRKDHHSALCHFFLVFGIGVIEPLSLASALCLNNFVSRPTPSCLSKCSYQQINSVMPMFGNRRLIRKFPQDSNTPFLSIPSSCKSIDTNTMNIMKNFKKETLRPNVFVLCQKGKQVDINMDKLSNSNLKKNENNEWNILGEIKKIVENQESFDSVVCSLGCCCSLS
jgi:hypothetical protein